MHLNGLFIEKYRFFPSVLQSDKIKFKISLFCETIGLFRNFPTFAAISAIFAKVSSVSVSISRYLSITSSPKGREVGYLINRHQCHFKKATKSIFLLPNTLNINISLYLYTKMIALSPKLIFIGKKI